MATTRFYLDTRRVKEDKPSPLKIAVSQNNETALITTDIKLRPNQLVGETVVNHDDSLVLTAYIAQIKSKILSILHVLTYEGVINDMTAKEIRDAISDEIMPNKKNKQIKENKYLFLYRFKRYADRMGKGSKHTYNYTLKRLEAFCAKPEQINIDKLKFEDITLDWLRQFDNYLAEEKSSKNTRNLHFRNIRTVFNEAIDDGITNVYPFRRFKIKNEITAERVLTVEEIRIIAYFNVEECGERYRDYFMLMFFLMGINNVDLCNLKEITKGRIVFNRQKTNHHFSMKVEPEAMAIIEKYKGENWLLNILDQVEDPVSFLKQCNKYLKKMGPVTRTGLGGKKTYTSLFPKLSTYYSRHSWASIASDLEIPDGTISDGLGHEHGNKVTRGYIHKYSYKNVDNANRKVIDWVLYGIKDGEVVVKPGTPEFFGLKRKEAEALGLVSKKQPKKEEKPAEKKRKKAA